jgi:hypothetical protein
VIIYGLAPMLSTQQTCLECWYVQGIFSLIVCTIPLSSSIFHLIVPLPLIGDFSPVSPSIPAGSLVSGGSMDSKCDLSFEILQEAPELI